MHERSALAIIDAILVRGLIPLWLLAGAVFKLIERNPGLLPSQIRKYASEHNYQDWLSPFMRGAIAVEIAAAAIMVFVPRLSRTVGIAILALFCAILINEIRANAESCGCMGNIKMPPELMLAIDGGMLLATIALGIALKLQAQAAPEAAPPRRAMPGVAIASVLAVLGVALAVSVPARTAVEITPENPQIADNNTTDSGADGAAPRVPPPMNLPLGAIANPNPAPLPGFYLASNINAWIGQPATSIDLIQLMRIWPEDIGTGTRHIIFYSRTCDHCEAMFHDHLSLDFDRPITVVEIPFDRQTMRGSSAWPMPETTAQQLALPVGTDWVVTPPLIITIENGIVTCAGEAEYEDCLGVEPTHEH